MIQLRSVRALIVVTLLLLASLFASAETAPRYFKLTILHTNDVHGHLLPFDYQSDRDVGGVARRATLIRNIKSDAKWPVILLDAGDVFTRGPLIRKYFGEPDIAAMNLIGYDLMTIGNNEFKGAEGADGQRVMYDRLQQAAFPVVCANVFDESTGKRIVPPYFIADIEGLKVGILGLTHIRSAEYVQTRGLSFIDPIAMAKELVPEVRSQSDVVIVLSHIGYDLDLKLAASVPGIDAIVGGDSHTFVFNPTVVKVREPEAFSIDGPVVVQDGEWGRYLGKLELYLRRSEEKGYQVMSFRGGLIPVNPSISEAADLNKLLKPYVKPYLKQVGKLENAVLQSEAAEWTAEAVRSALGTDVGAESETGVGSGLPAGKVTLLDVMKMVIFDNRIVRVKLTGAQLMQLSANGVALAGAEGIDLDAVYSVAMENYALTLCPASETIVPEPTDMQVSDAIVWYLQQKR